MTGTIFFDFRKFYENNSLTFIINIILIIFFSFRIVNTPYEVVMGEDVNCRLLCHDPSRFMTWDEANSQHVIQMIQHEYFVHLLEHFIVIYV